MKSWMSYVLLMTAAFLSTTAFTGCTVEVEEEGPVEEVIEEAGD